MNHSIALLITVARLICKSTRCNAPLELELRHYDVLNRECSGERSNDEPNARACYCDCVPGVYMTVDPGASLLKEIPQDTLFEARECDLFQFRLTAPAQPHDGLQRSPNVDSAGSISQVVIGKGDHVSQGEETVPDSELYEASAGRMACDRVIHVKHRES